MSLGHEDLTYAHGGRWKGAVGMDLQGEKDDRADNEANRRSIQAWKHSAKTARSEGEFIECGCMRAAAQAFSWPSCEGCSID